MAVVRYTVANGEIIAEKRNGVRRSYVPDPLGSTIALLDNTQTKTDTFSYWPYGEVQSRTGTTATPFQFVGTLGYYRDATDRMYVRARYLRPNLGRWQTVDPYWPVEEAFGYAGANPLTYVDFSGKSWLPTCHVSLVEETPCDKCKRLGRNVPPNWKEEKNWDDSIRISINRNCKKFPNITLQAVLCWIYAESDGNPRDGEGTPNRGLLQISKGLWDNLCSDLGTWDPNVYDPKKNIECALRLLCSDKYKFKGEIRWDPVRRRGWGTVGTAFHKFDCCKRCQPFRDRMLAGRRGAEE